MKRPFVGVEFTMTAVKRRPLYPSLHFASRLPITTNTMAHYIPPTYTDFVQNALAVRILACDYWNETCAVIADLDTLVSEARKLNFIGGAYNKPDDPDRNEVSDFSCLLYKMLQLQPPTKLVVREFFAHDRAAGSAMKALGAMYVRLVFPLFRPVINSAKDRTAHVRICDKFGRPTYCQLNEYLDILMTRDDVLQVRLPPAKEMSRE